MAKKKQKSQVKKKVQQSNTTKPIPEHYITYGVLGLVAALVILIKWNFLGISFERDEGIYAYFGQLVLEGKRPYLDFYEMKFPGIFYSYAILVGIFGATVEGLHGAFIMINLATIFFIYKTGKHFLGNSGGLFAAIIFAILSMTKHASGFTTQSEHLVIFYACAGFWAMTAAFESQKKHHFILSGILLCLSMLVKTNGVFFIMAGGIWGLIYYLSKGQKDKLIQNGLWYSVGVFGTFGFFCLLMMIQGGLGEMFYWTLEHSKTYVSSISTELGMTLLKSTFKNLTTGYWPFWALGFAGFGLTFLIKMDFYKKLSLLTLGVFSAITIIPGFRFYGHYWLQLMPGLALMAAASLVAIKQLLAEPLGANNSAMAVGAGVGIFALLNLVNFQDYYFNPDHTQILREVYSTNPFPETRVVGDFIKARTTSDDQIALIGSEPQLHFYTNRRSPSRHAYFSYLLSDATKTKATEWQQEFQASMEASKPKYLVVFNHNISIMQRPNANLDILSKWLPNFIGNYYKKVGIVDMIGPGNTNYVLEESNAINYKPQTQYQNQNYFIDIFERK